ncbi:hypothetical protein GGR34_001182 [Microvirga flocculans]|uniref:Uncharacterized protein n=1 Tax=Microvirga flocculans TaxID=217168 RepID=A0A7W6N7J7_9HYPH|nr:hypothetical protein [Microvirga flocculans]MBB4039540.1 hypothetical protein [Microvirga flocculans]
MRIKVTVPIILLSGLVLSGCIASMEPVGVLPRDPVPPPPSIAGDAPRRNAASGKAEAQPQRRGLSVPSRAASPRP